MKSKLTRTPLYLLAVGAFALGGLAACSSDSDGASSTTEAAAESTTEPVVTEPMNILISNDDGYEAEGLDALVQGVETLDDVDIVVVAPLEQQSGTGGQTSEGDVADLAVTQVETAGGFPASAVDGFPSDAINVAFEELDVQPDLVVTGINEGQNLGPLVDISGTVGAARAAVARGVPALASSQGTGAETFDYEAAVPLILAWIEENREAIMAGDAPVEVTSLNIPSCSEGELRGTLDTEPDVEGDGGAALQPQDCTSTVAESELTLDVAAFNNGFATFSVLDPEPAS